MKRWGVEQEINLCTCEVNSNHEIKFISTGDVVKEAIQVFLDKPINKKLAFHNLEVLMLEMRTSCSTCEDTETWGEWRPYHGVSSQKAVRWN